MIVKQVDGDTTFYFIPTTDLPLLDPLRSLGVPEPVLNIFQPALQVIVEAGYDRSIPFGDPTPAELIPSIDPVTFTLEFANGVVQGANNAFELFGAQLPDFTSMETCSPRREAWSEADVGVPYDQFVTELNTDFNPFTAFIDIEAPLGQRTSKTCWNSPASNRICSTGSSDSSDRSAECSPAEPIRRIGRAGIHAEALMRQWN